MNELALFAGAGGGVLGGHLLGWRTVCAVEIEDYPRRVLLQRQADGILPRFPIWDDVCTFDGKQWRGRIDIVTGGFPCQNVSVAGNGEGLEGEYSGLWTEMARIIGEVRPRFAFVENSPALTSRGLGTVLGDLAEMGYNARWGVLGAADVGAKHKRDRMWVFAYSNEAQRKRVGSTKSIKKKYNPAWRFSCNGDRRRETCPGIQRVTNVMANRVDRLKAIGNGQVPAVAAIAFLVLSQGLTD